MAMRVAYGLDELAPADHPAFGRQHHGELKSHRVLPCPGNLAVSLAGNLAVKLARHRRRASQQARGEGDVASGNRCADLGAPDRVAVQFKRRQHHNVKPGCKPQTGKRCGRTRALIAKRRVGRHQEARKTAVG